MFKLFKNLFVKGKKMPLFLDTLKEYIDKYKSENPLAQSTERRYDNYYHNTVMFMSCNKLQNIGLDEVRIVHAEQFRSWLKSNLKTCNLRHASRHVELWKNVTKYGVKMEYIVNDVLSPIKSERDKTKKITALSNTEVKKLMVYKFNKDTYRVVADLFLFQCFTGLTYCDMYKCQITDNNGHLWIEGDRTKSDTHYTAFFFPEAKAIWQKYEGKLPKMSNQRYNEYIKDVAEFVGIKKHLTTHVGRKTHATLLSERGMNTKPISMTLGNTERITEESYIDKTHRIIINEINRNGLTDGLVY